MVLEYSDIILLILFALQKRNKRISTVQTDQAIILCLEPGCKTAAGCESTCGTVVYYMRPAGAFYVNRLVDLPVNIRPCDWEKVLINNKTSAGAGSDLYGKEIFIWRIICE